MPAPHGDPTLIQPNGAGDPVEPQLCQFCQAPATHSLLWADGDAYTPVCTEHDDEARDAITTAGHVVSNVEKVRDTPDPNTANAYWLAHPAIRWNQPGALDRCISVMSSHSSDPRALCQRLQAQAGGDRG